MLGLTAFRSDFDSSSFLASETLFNIERSRDANQIVYKLNLDDGGILDKEEPIQAFWVKYKDKGEVEPITWIQKELSYGLKFKSISEDKTTFQFAAYNKKDLYLRNDFGSYKVYAISNDKFVELERIFVHFNGGTDWLPTVEYVEIFSKEVVSGELISEKIYP